MRGGSTHRADTGHNPRMRVIVIGAGEVGQNIVSTLSSVGHDVTVVDGDEARVAQLQHQLDALVLVGNGASPRFLAELDAGSADLLLAVTQSDEVNAIAALSGHLLGATRTVARVRDDDYFGADESFAHDVLGIDFVIHPERATAEDLAAAILLPGAIRVEYFGDGRIAVAECILHETSTLIDCTVSERRMTRPHYIVGYVRDGVPSTARPEDRLDVGDRVLVAAAREHIAVVVSELAGEALRVRDVLIFGGGRVGFPLARRLEAAGNFEVTVMERDERRARFIAERLPNTTVLHEEGVGKEELLLHGVDQVGAFVACAGDDRSNLLAALHAQQLGASLCMAVVSRQEFVPLVAAMGIDVAYSPRLATAEAILRFVRGEQVRAMHLLFSGAELLELYVEPGSHIDGAMLVDFRIPSGGQAAAVLRGEQVLLPLEGLRVEPHDRVLLFGPRGSSSDVERMFNA